VAYEPPVTSWPICRPVGRSSNSAGETLASDACAAAAGGAQVVFVDTGQVGDLEQVAGVLRARGLRDKVELAFGGGVELADLDTLRTLDVDTVDVGRAIVDAPLLDMSLRVTGGDTP